MTNNEEDSPAVLQCEHCDGVIAAGELGGAMFFWDGAPAPAPVRAASLLHKLCVDRSSDFGRHRHPYVRDGEGDFGLSIELDSFADPGAALWHLARLSLDFNFTAEQLAELVRVAWATSINANSEERERGHRSHPVALELRKQLDRMRR